MYVDGEPFLDRDGMPHAGNVISFVDEDGGTGGQPDDLIDTWAFDTTMENDAQISLINLSASGLPGTHADAVSPKSDGTMDVVLTSR